MPRNPDPDLDLPVIVVDTREQTPLAFETLPSKVGTLTSGDYSVEGLEHVLAVERKSVADLVGSLTQGRDRFERELHRLRECDVVRLLVVGEGGTIDPRLAIAHGRCRSRMRPQAIVASLAAHEHRYRILSSSRLRRLTLRASFERCSPRNPKAGRPALPPTPILDEPPSTY